jgi:hypothetical protein
LCQQQQQSSQRQRQKAAATATAARLDCDHVMLLAYVEFQHKLPDITGKETQLGLWMTGFEACHVEYKSTMLHLQ